MPNFPVTYGDSHFCFAAYSDNEILVKVMHKTYDFFIQIREKNGTYLIKAEKITRPSQVVFVHQAMRDFRDLSGCEVLFSNIDSHKNKTLKSYAVLKNIGYFLDEFQYDKEIWVEVGFGSGRHLLHQAKAHPNIQFVGLEIHKPSIEQAAKQCELQGVDNMALLDFDARIFFEFLATNSVGRIFVHFPVPWDEKPHRRVISQDFIQESLRILRPKGTLELRTDSDKYFHYSLEEFLRLNKVTLSIHKNQDLDISSKYEDRWKRQDKDIYDLTLTHHETNKTREKVGKLDFKDGYDFATIKKYFAPTLRKDDTYFLHIEKMYQIDVHAGVIKISFGSSFKNERAFVHFSSNETKYFPDNILATKANKKAHESMKEWLDEIQK